GPDDVVGHALVDPERDGVRADQGRAAGAHAGRGDQRTHDHEGDEHTGGQRVDDRGRRVGQERDRADEVGRGAVRPSLHGPLRRHQRRVMYHARPAAKADFDTGNPDRRDSSPMTSGENGRGPRGSRQWANEAVRRIEADENRSADTHLHAFPLPPRWGIDLYLKDESVHPTGSLKHRLARSLFLYGLCNGWITEQTTVVDASSGSTAVSEAYFARFLGLPFVAVMPASTSPEKIALIEAEGGSCHLVDDP